ncbi:MAG: hypothetical protein ACM3XR_09155 [Bacillota bacterium]
MTKKVIAIFFVIVIVTLSIIMINRYSQHILVWQANKKINVDGIKLMMAENEAKRIIGEEEAYIPGFGGYKLEYPSKGIFLTFLNDRDTDFYSKVNIIEVIDSEYEVFGVKVGDEFDKAVEILYNQGFTQGKDGYPGYWRANLYIVLHKNQNKVQKITVGVRDRVASSRVY